MKKRICLMVIVCLTLLIGCQPFKKLNKRLDAIEGKMDTYHQEEMSTMQKNHKEAMAIITALNEAIRRKSGEMSELAGNANTLIEQGFMISGQIYPQTTIHVREGPSVRFKSLGYLKGGEIVKINRIERKWVRIMDGKWKGKWCTMLYMQLSVEPL